MVFVIGLSCSTKKELTDNEKIEKTVRGLLTWYSSNWDSLAVDLINPIIENSILKIPDSTKPYKINFEATERYLSVYRQSGFISESYLNYYREYFKECQKNFELEPQTMGPGTGFEYDFIFRGQDYGYQKENPDKAEIIDIKINSDKAIATVKFDETYIYLYALTKVNDTWLIDRIKGRWEK